MNLYDTISSDMKHAMRARDKVRLGALRQIRAAFTVEVKKSGGDSLDDAGCVTVLRRLAKQRADSISAYEAAGRADLRDQEVAELAVIETYLPSLADEATTQGWVDAAMAETGAAGPSDMGKVMGALMRAHKGEIDGGLAKRLVLEALKNA